MLAVDLITDEIPPLKTSDTGLKALNWMDEFKVSHLPIVNKVKLLGLISDTDILDMNSPEEAIGNHELSMMKAFVNHKLHLYQVIKVVASLNLTLIPVLDDDENYLGIITLNKLLQEMSNISAINEPGGIVILELNVNDYSLSTIAQIVESNNAKILSSYITSHSDSTKLEVTLKINRSDLTTILKTFERYNYTIKASFHQSEMVDDVKVRFEMLMNYLNT
jgi:acetoin utilization protein AcuB